MWANMRHVVQGIHMRIMGIKDWIFWFVQVLETIKYQARYIYCGDELA